MPIYVEETGIRFTAADRVWIATALLHQENPSQKDFSLREIVSRAEKENLVESGSNTFYVHANQHCVANRPPNPGNHRVLVETRSGRRRLFCSGDTTSPGRVGKIHPNPEQIPTKYRGLLNWYERIYCPCRRSDTESVNPLLALYGSGRKLWAEEHADEYVARLREGWE